MSTLVTLSLQFVVSSVPASETNQLRKFRVNVNCVGASMGWLLRWSSRIVHASGHRSIIRFLDRIDLALGEIFVFCFPIVELQNAEEDCRWWGWVLKVFEQASSLCSLWVAWLYMFLIATEVWGLLRWCFDPRGGFSWLREFDCVLMLLMNCWTDESSDQEEDDDGVSTFRLPSPVSSPNAFEFEDTEGVREVEACVGLTRDGSICKHLWIGKEHWCSCIWILKPSQNRPDALLIACSIGDSFTFTNLISPNLKETELG